MTQETEALNILAEQRATITISEHKVRVDCNNREDAYEIFEWLCSLCNIEVI